MSDPNLPLQPFAKTSGWVVPAEKVKCASYGGAPNLEEIEAEVAHGEWCTFLVIRTKGEAQYFKFAPECTAVLGHALSVAVKR